MRAYLTRKEANMIRRARKRAYIARQFRVWIRKDVKPVLIRVFEAVLGLSFVSMMFWGCGFDSANFVPVLKMFLISAAVALMAAGGIWMLGEEL
ncbi:MAG: hypothetical protein Q4B86_07355 [Eubacteriales bacterium]|nr:hypothetical protein [Eubacteriales bacterium]